MSSLINYLLIFICSNILLYVVDDNPREVVWSEYLMYGLVLYSGYSLFKIMLTLWKQQFGEDI